MSFLPGYGVQVLANEVVVSSQVSGATMTHQRATSDVTTMGQVVATAGSNFVPGLMSGTMALRGPQDNLGAGLHAEILGAVGVDNDLLLTALPGGDAIGAPALFALGDPTDWAIDAAVADAVGFTLAAAADESVEMGWVLHSLGAETVDGNSASVDRGASPSTPTTHGGAFGLHVTAYSGLTSAALRVEHSTDNASWATLASFASVTAVGRQLVKVANGTTVNRYLRCVTDVTGSGSVTFLMTAAPR